jgi:hypothetical protein
MFKKGFSIVEVVIAIGITSVLLPPIYYAFLTARDTRPNQEQRVKSTNSLVKYKEITQLLRQSDWASMVVSRVYYAKPIGSGWQLVEIPLGNPCYNTGIVNEATAASPPIASDCASTDEGILKRVEVLPVGRDSSGRICDPINGTTCVTDSSTKKVSIKTSWNFPIAGSITNSFYSTRYLNTVTASYGGGFIAGGSSLDSGNIKFSTSNGGEVILSENPGQWCKPKLLKKDGAGDIVDPSLPAYTSAFHVSVDVKGTPTAMAGIEGSSSNPLDSILGPNKLVIAANPGAVGSDQTVLNFVTSTQNNNPEIALNAILKVHPSFATLNDKFYSVAYDSAAGYAYVTSSNPNAELIRVPIPSNYNDKNEYETNDILCADVNGSTESGAGVGDCGKNSNPKLLKIPRDIIVGTTPTITPTPTVAPTATPTATPTPIANLSNTRYIVFASSATNLVASDTNSLTDIFRKDLVAGTVIRVNTTSASAQATGGVSDSPAITSDGRYVTFRSDATNLVASDTNALSDIFRKDINTGAIVRVNTTSASAQATGGTSTTPTISSDGNLITFTSVATNLVASDTNALQDVFQKNISTAAITRVNTDSASAQATGGVSGNGAITTSADGRYVLFTSAATNLVASDTNAVQDIFRKDMNTGAIVRINTTSAGAQATGSSTLNATMSSDSNIVTFETGATNLVASDTNALTDVFVKNVTTGAISLVSTTSAGVQATGGVSVNPDISDDGRYVAFTSLATNLATTDTNAVGDIFLKDTTTATLTLISGTNATTTGNGASSFSTITPNASHVVFATLATNLIAGDTNGVQDLLIKNISTSVFNQVNTTSSGAQGNGAVPIIISYPTVDNATPTPTFTPTPTGTATPTPTNTPTATPTATPIPPANKIALRVNLPGADGTGNDPLIDTNNTSRTPVISNVDATATNSEGPYLNRNLSTGFYAKTSGNVVGGPYSAQYVHTTGDNFGSTANNPYQPYGSQVVVKTDYVSGKKYAFVSQDSTGMDGKFYACTSNGGFNSFYDSPTRTVKRCVSTIRVVDITDNTTFNMVQFTANARTTGNVSGGTNVQNLVGLEIPTPNINKMYIRGNYLYLAVSWLSDSELFVVDISNPLDGTIFNYPTRTAVTRVTSPSFACGSGNATNYNADNTKINYDTGNAVMCKTSVEDFGDVGTFTNGLDVDPSGCSYDEIGKDLYVGTNNILYAALQANNDSCKKIYTVDVTNTSPPKLRIKYPVAAPPVSASANEATAATEVQTIQRTWGYNPGNNFQSNGMAVVGNTTRLIVVGKDADGATGGQEDTYQVLDSTTPASVTRCNTDADATVLKTLKSESGTFLDGIGVVALYNQPNVSLELPGKSWVFVLTNDTGGRDIKVIRGGEDGYYLENGTYISAPYNPDPLAQDATGANVPTSLQSNPVIFNKFITNMNVPNKDATDGTQTSVDIQIAVTNQVYDSTLSKYLCPDICPATYTKGNQVLGVVDGLYRYTCTNSGGGTVVSPYGFYTPTTSKVTDNIAGNNGTGVNSNSDYNAVTPYTDFTKRCADDGGIISSSPTLWSSEYTYNTATSSNIGSCFRYVAKFNANTARDKAPRLCDVNFNFTP